VESSEDFSLPGLNVGGAPVIEGGISEIIVDVNNFSAEGAVSFHLKTDGGSAVANEDYVPIDDDFVIPMGTKRISIPLVTINIQSQKGLREIDFVLTNVSGAPVAKVKPVAILDSEPAEKMRASQLALGTTHSCALGQDGFVRCWGLHFGGFNDPDGAGKVWLPQIISADRYPLEIKSGYNYTCARYKDSRILCWGFYIWGSSRSALISYAPELRASGTGLKGFDANMEMVCGVTTSNSLQCRGYNYLSMGGPIATFSSSYVDMGFTGTTQQISIGRDHACRLTGGAVECWGSNADGQLGNGSVGGESATPQSTGLIAGMIKVVTNDSTTCALHASGHAYCWGYNGSGLVGQSGLPVQQPTPVMPTGLGVVKDIGVGNLHACALLHNGTVKCWGGNSKGQLGIGTNTATTTPTLVTRLPGKVASIEISDYKSCAILEGGGDVYCWGDPDNGQVPFARKDGAVPVPRDIKPLLGLEVEDIRYKELSSKGYGCARLSNGELRCWGRSVASNLGNPASSYTSAQPVLALGAVSDFSIGSGGTGCAILNAGGINCWGDNAGGGVGDGTQVTPAVPTAPTGLAADNVKSLDIRFTQSAAVLSDGSVQEWGVDGVLAPQTRAGVANAEKVVNGASHSCALIDDGTVRCWGKSDRGQLGNGTIDVLPAAAATPTLPEPIQDLAAGGRHTCALGISGAVYCWGNNEFGQLGIGKLDQMFSTPQAVPKLQEGVEAIAAGGDHTCARLVSGGMRCWGRNNFGQLGTGEYKLGSFVTAPVAVRGLDFGVTKISLNGDVSCAITRAKTAKCWGRVVDEFSEFSGVTVPRLLIQPENL
jgi:alpha-tubulin suppressor-like RCC1 family protein